MSLLKKEIDKLEYLLNNAKAEKDKAFYASNLSSLKYIQSQLDANYKYDFDDKTYDILCDTTKHLMHNIHSQIIRPEYIAFVNALVKNALKQYKHAILECQHFEKKYTLKETKELLCEFFDKFNPYLYKLIKKSLNSEHLHIVRNSNKNDITVCCNFQSGNCYTTMHHDGKFGIDNISDIAHEMGHIINMNMFKENHETNKSKLHCSNFSESSSMIFELLFTDYLITNKIDTLEAYKDENRQLIILGEELYDLQYVNKFASELPLVVPYKKLNDENIHDLHSAYKKYSYTYGYLLAFYYLEKYHEDPERAKRNILNFINSITTMSDLETFNHFDINLNNFIRCNYIKNPIKECQKILK